MQSIPRVYIFGAGSAGLVTLELLGGYFDCELIGMVDNDASKHGSSVCGFKVVSAETLLGATWDLVIVSSTYSGEILEQLRSMGIDDSRVLVAPVAVAPEAIVEVLGGAGLPKLEDRYRDFELTDDIRKVVVYGTGTSAVDAWAKICMRDDLELVCFVDSSSHRWGRTFLGKPIVGPRSLATIDFEHVIIGSCFVDEIGATLLACGVAKGRIHTASWLIGQGAREPSDTTRNLSRLPPRQMSRTASRQGCNIVARWLVECLCPGRFLVAHSGNPLIPASLAAQGAEVEAFRPDGRTDQPRAARAKGGLFDLPFTSGSYDAVVVTDIIRSMDEAGLAAAVAEIRRVCNRYLVLLLQGLSYTFDFGGVAGRDRTWWETELCRLGFSVYLGAGDAAVDLPQSQTGIHAMVFEKLELSEADALGTGLDTDLCSRFASSGADGLYQIAASFLRPGMQVLNAGCGGGYGSAILYDHGEGSAVVGVDSDPQHIAYANACHAGEGRPLMAFAACDLAQLDFTDDGAVDMVVAIDVLESNAPVENFLREAQRVLRPGGRLLVSLRLPSDPSLARLVASGEFLGEQIITTLNSGRTSDAVDWDEGVSRIQLMKEGAVVLVAMKNPFVDASVSDRSSSRWPRPTTGLAAIDGSRGYLNPYLIDSMILTPYRARSRGLLMWIANKALQEYPLQSADAGGALCVLAYQWMEEGLPTEVRDRIARYLLLQPADRHQFRWQVSLRFALGKVVLASGHGDQARHHFDKCSKMDFTIFGPHLATKCSEAAFLSGWIAYLAKDWQGAEDAWKRGLSILDRVKQYSVDEMLLDPELPNRFERGDGLREITIVFDNAIRCANGLRSLGLRKRSGQMNARSINVSYQAAHEEHQRLIASRGGEILALRKILEAPRNSADEEPGMPSQ